VDDIGNRLAVRIDQHDRRYGSLTKAVAGDGA